MPEAGDVLPSTNLEAPKIQAPIDESDIAPKPEKQIDLLPKAFVGSEFEKRLSARKLSGESVVGLFTDIDDTFLKEGHADTSSEIDSLAEAKNVPIAAVTGRNIKNVLERIKSPENPDGDLPYFQVIASSVGTEIWVLHIDENGIRKYVRDDEFAGQLAGGMYNRNDVASLGQMLVDQDSELHPEWQLDFQQPDLENNFLQGKEVNVEPFKVSFNAFLASPEELSNIRLQLEDRFVGQKVIISEGKTIDKATGRKHYNIDILPATKADAVNYIREKTNIDSAFVAGNGGNDTAMLLESGDISIGVGGSDDEVDESIREVAPRRTKGKKSFGKDEKGKIYYLETGERVGPGSIKYALEVIERAHNISKIRTVKQSADLTNAA